MIVRMFPVILMLVMNLRAGPRTDPFQDVPRGHWMYRAADDLVKTGLVQCIPPIWFPTSGDRHRTRILTRYEFAVMVDRAQLELQYRESKIGHVKLPHRVRAELARLKRELRKELRMLRT